MGKLGKITAGALSVLTIVGSGVAIAKRQDIADWIALRNYTPSAVVSSLADKTTMSAEARKLFYVYDPRLLNETVFNEKCTVTEETIILGCYDGEGIYLFDISDPQLDGVEEVTSAHEMLHAAYDRLSGREKEQVGALLDQALTATSNQRIKSLVESYRRRDPSSVANELHSIIGTEMRTIPAELEEYYRRYFDDRLKVVAYSEKYEAVFTDLKNQVEQLDADLALRKAEIEGREADLASRAAELDAWSSRLERYRAENNISQYNAEVDQFNSAVAAYNQDLQRTRDLIAEYNLLVEQRNNIALQQNALIHNLDSKARNF